MGWMSDGEGVRSERASQPLPPSQSSEHVFFLTLCCFGGPQSWNIGRRRRRRASSTWKGRRCSTLCISSVCLSCPARAQSSGEEPLGKSQSKPPDDLAFCYLTCAFCIVHQHNLHAMGQVHLRLPLMCCLSPQQVQCMFSSVLVSGNH
jgi:hypothetical protein